jgi:hypothetical protein
MRSSFLAMRRALLLTILLASIAAPAQAQDGLPVGESHGVRAERSHGSLVLVFSPRAAKLRRRINSPYAWIECTQVADGLFSGVHSGNLDVPRRGRKVDTGFGVRGEDYCRIFLRAHRAGRRHVPRRTLFSISLTQAGAVYLDEEAKTVALLRVSLAVELVREKAKRPGAVTYARLIRGLPQLQRVVVELAASGDSPPPGKVGYFSDGAEHTVLAVLSGLGRRLFIERSAGGVLTTNVAAHLGANPLSPSR